MQIVSLFIWLNRISFAESIVEGLLQMISGTFRSIPGCLEEVTVEKCSAIITKAFRHLTEMFRELLRHAQETSLAC